MKITKRQLRQIIKEEAEKLELEPMVITGDKPGPCEKGGIWSPYPQGSPGQHAGYVGDLTTGYKDRHTPELKAKLLCHVDWLIENLPAFKEELLAVESYADLLQ